MTTDDSIRKNTPVTRGVLDYFPDALMEIARLSKAGNDKHNPGQDMHWSRGKSSDHADCILRHLVDRNKIDKDGFSHTVKVAWRALALLQEECERVLDLPLPRGARYDAIETLEGPRETEDTRPDPRPIEEHEPFQPVRLRTTMCEDQGIRRRDWCESCIEELAGEINEAVATQGPAAPESEYRLAAEVVPAPKSRGTKRACLSAD